MKEGTFEGQLMTLILAMLNFTRHKICLVEMYWRRERRIWKRGKGKM